MGVSKIGGGFCFKNPRVLQNPRYDMGVCTLLPCEQNPLFGGFSENPRKGGGDLTKRRGFWETLSWFQKSLDGFVSKCEGFAKIRSEHRMDLTHYSFSNELY